MRASSSTIKILIFVSVGLIILSSVFVKWSASDAHATGTFPSHFFSPYTDITLSGPSLQSVTQSTGQKFYTLAFVDNGGEAAMPSGPEQSHLIRPRRSSLISIVT